MTKKSICLLFTAIGLAIMISACETPPEPMPAKACEPSPSLSDSKRMAQGAQHDSLQACMDRIPCDASDSQKMLAKETCNATFASEGRKDFDKLPQHKRDPK